MCVQNVRHRTEWDCGMHTWVGRQTVIRRDVVYGRSAVGSGGSVSHRRVVGGLRIWRISVRPGNGYWRALRWVYWHIPQANNPGQRLPRLVKCPFDEDRYIRGFNISEGIRLYKNAIRKNTAERGLTKLCLNSMCGKLTERKRAKTKVITDSQELYRFLSTPGIEVANLMFASETVWASWRFIVKESVTRLKHTNEVIGAGASIHLYSYLDRLQ